MKLKRPPKEEFERLYLKEGKSTIDIAELLGISRTTARQWIVDAEIPLRDQREVISMKKGTERPSKSTLRRLYKRERLTTTQIAERYKVTRTTVCRWMEQAQLKRREESEAKLSRGVVKPKMSELRRLYHEEDMSPHEIANKYSVSNVTILNWMDSYGIKRKNYRKKENSEVWQSLDFALQQANKFLEEHPEHAELPGERILDREGFSDLASGIRYYHGGFPTFRKKLNDFLGKPIQIKGSGQFVDFIRQNSPAQNLAAVALAMNGDGAEIETAFFEIYRDRFRDQQRLHALIQTNKDDIYDVLREGITNLGHYVGEFTLTDRTIIPVLIGQAMSELGGSNIGSSVQDKLVRVLRSSYGPQFNQEPRAVLSELESRAQSAEGVARDIYQRLYSHYSETLQLQEELN